jgi:hypothetical protein
VRDALLSDLSGEHRAKPVPPERRVASIFLRGLAKPSAMAWHWPSGNPKDTEALNFVDLLVACPAVEVV